jgi:hypothetical protein
MATTCYHFSTAGDRARAMHLLIFMAQKLARQEKKDEEEQQHLDYVDALHIGGCVHWIAPGYSDDEQREDALYCFQLGEGTHQVWFEERLLTVQVTVNVGQPTSERYIAFEHYEATLVSKQFSIAGLENREQMDRLLSDASAYVTALLRQEDETGRARRVGHFTFDARTQRFAHMGLLRLRDPDSLFLKEGEHDTVFEMVGDFLESRAEYERCAVPHKLNLLLHGPSGTGKTALIGTLASHFGLNLAVIPFSPHLTDESLATGITLACQMGCRIIALEDADCLFNNNVPKEVTLPVINRLLRTSAAGLIMILTTSAEPIIPSNNVMDAVCVDFALPFTYADQFQTQKCFAFYSRILQWDFTEAEWALFWEAISAWQFTPALLQQFFFAGRALPREEVLSPERLQRLLPSSVSSGGSSKQLVAAAQQQQAKRRWFYN